MLLGIRWRSLRAKIIAWSFVPTAIILLAVALVAFFAYQRVTEDLVIERNRELTRLTASQLAGELAEYTGDLESLARTAGISGGLPAAQRQALRDAGNRLAVFDAGAALLDYHGAVVAAEPDRPGLQGRDWSDQPFFRQMLRTRSPVFSDILELDAGAAMPVVAVAVPVYGPRGEFVGALAGFFRVGAATVSALYGSIVKLRRGVSEDVYLVDGAGRGIYLADSQRIGQDLSGQAAVALVAQERVGAFRADDLTGRDSVIAFAPVPGTSWGLVNSVSWDALLQPSQGYRQFLILLLVLGVAAPAIVVAVGTRRITRPIADLIAAAGEVASGQFGRTVAARTGDEVELLVQQFNVMSGRLAESYAALRAREERLELVMRATNDGIWDWDMRTGQVYFSPRWKGMLGYADDEVGDHFEEWRRLTHPDDAGPAAEVLRAYLDGRAAHYALEHRMRHKDGTYRWILAQGVALRDAEGRPCRMVGSHTDITPRKQAEAALQERAAFERLLSAISTEFVNLGPGDIDAGIRHALQAVGQFAGADRSYAYRFSEDGARVDGAHEWCADGIDPRHPSMLGAPLSRAPYLSERIRRLEVIRAAGLSDLPAEAGAERAELAAAGVQSMVCVPMAHRGRVVGCVGLETASRAVDWGEDSVALLRMVSEIFANALEHNRAQEALRKSEVRFRTVFEGAPVGMRVGDWTDRVSWSNPALERMLGFTNDELLRLSLADFAYPEDALLDLRLYREMLEGKRDQYQAEKRFVRKDGQMIWGRVTGAITRDSEGKPAVSLVMVEDITEQKRAQEALQRSHQTLERRVAERTHELETLNAVAGVVSRSIDLGEVMGDVLDKTMAVAGMETGAAYRLDDAGQSLELVAHRGLSESFVARVARMPLRLALAGRSFDTEQLLVWRVEADYPAGLMKDLLLEEGLRGVLGVPLFAKGRLAGALAISTRSDRLPNTEESALLAAIGQQIGIAVENARLREQAELAAAANERSRLARELHDSVTQSLYSLTLYAEAASRLVAAGRSADAAGHLRDVRDTAREALREMRLLIFELRPPELERAGLAGALQARLDAVETRGGMQARLEVEGAALAGQLSFAAQNELYHIAREALNNALKHARAQSVRVRLQCGAAGVRLEIRDDGAGFEPRQAEAGGGLGLDGMRERAQRIGGRLSVDSSPGQGTRIVVEAPLARPGGTG